MVHGYGQAVSSFTIPLAAGKRKGIVNMLVQNLKPRRIKKDHLWVPRKILLKNNRSWTQRIREVKIGTKIQLPDP